MTTGNRNANFGQFMTDYGMLFVLLVFMAVLSLVTIDRQQATGRSAGREVANHINRITAPANVLIATPQGKLDLEFAEGVQGIV
ncbi:MAG: hypothetical protein GTO41_03840, partial [Burkholderiales bacterium]|nr:hypothetical protein [Burkholderiales bacterium]